MMSREQALERLKTCLDCGDCLICKEMEEAIEVSIEAIEFVSEMLTLISVLHEDDELSAEITCRRLYKHGFIDKEDNLWMLGEE